MRYHLISYDRKPLICQSIIPNYILIVDIVRGLLGSINSGGRAEGKRATEIFAFATIIMFQTICDLLGKISRSEKISNLGQIFISWAQNQTMRCIRFNF